MSGGEDDFQIPDELAFLFGSEVNALSRRGNPVRLADAWTIELTNSKSDTKRAISN